MILRLQRLCYDPLVTYTDGSPQVLVDTIPLAGHRLILCQWSNILPYLPSALIRMN